MPFAVGLSFTSCMPAVRMSKILLNIYEKFDPIMRYLYVVGRSNGREQVYPARRARIKLDFSELAPDQILDTLFGRSDWQLSATCMWRNKLLTPSFDTDATDLIWRYAAEEDLSRSDNSAQFHRQFTLNFDLFDYSLKLEAVRQAPGAVDQSMYRWIWSMDSLVMDV